MGRIESLARYVPPAPQVGDRHHGHDRRVGNRDRRRADGAAVVIDLRPDEIDVQASCRSEAGPRPAAVPVPAAGRAEASREVLAYEVISRLGSEAGFGEKGRLVSVYL